MQTLTNHLALPRRTIYNLFSKCNIIREGLTNKKHNVKWLLVIKRKNMYPMISDSLKVKIQN